MQTEVLKHIAKLVDIVNRIWRGLDLYATWAWPSYFSYYGQIHAWAHPSIYPCVWHLDTEGSIAVQRKANAKVAED